MRIALPASLDAAGLAGHDATACVRALGGATMGTRWSVRMAAPAGYDVTPLQAAIEVRLTTIVRQMSQWEPGSTLSRFNAAPPGTWAILPADFAAVIDRALRIARASDGAFDPALGRLVDLWGYGALAVAGPPNAAAIAAARARSGWRWLAWEPGARCLLQPGGVALDLAGIAKGYAVDAVADLLAEHGFAHCLVEIGGELVGRGLRPDGDPWWVELEVPPDTAIAPLRIALHGLAVATSGDYRRGGHTLDPRTGRGTTNRVVATSVIAPRAVDADAWATALGVLGPAAGLALAERHGLPARIVTRDGVEHLSPALVAMLSD